MTPLLTKPDAGWHIDAGDEWRQPRVLDWSGQVVAVLPEESDRARLIAAAPDMLAALISSRTVIQEDRDALFDSVTVAGIASTMDDVDRPHIERLDAVLAEINGAIAKAEGRQQ